MTDNETPGKKPDFKVDGVAVWKNYTKDKELYLTVKMVGHNPVNVFKNNPKPKPEEEL